MNEYTTFTGKTVDEAVNNALISLQVPSDRLEYEVVEKGSSGLLGFIGSKPAVIKARRKAEEVIQEVIKPVVEEKVKPVIREEIKKAQAAPAPKKEAPKKEESRKEEPKKEAPKPQAKPETKAVPEKKPEAKKAEPAAEEPADQSVESIFDEEKNIEPTVFDGTEPEFLTAGKDFLDSVFKEMGLDIDVVMRYNPDEETVSIDLIGDNMGLLIGKRGQTLDSLQHLVSLVMNKKSEAYLRIKLDTENYRERRRENLERLAKSVAGKVKRTRKPVALEAMNPYERRIIHSVLQDDKFVYTKSEGEDPYRHVVVIPNQEAYSANRKNYHNNRNYGSRKKENSYE